MHMSAEPSPLNDMTQGVMYNMTVTTYNVLPYALCIRGLQKGSRIMVAILISADQ